MTMLEGRYLDRIDPSLRRSATTCYIDLSESGYLAERERVLRYGAEYAPRVSVEGVRIEDASVPGPDGRPLALRIYRGGNEVPGALVLYAHGGGFVTGNLDTDHGHCVELARGAGCTVVSVDYRLAPEYPYPAAINDMDAALEYLVSRPDVFGDATDRLVVMGRDAGAGVIATLAQKVFDQQGPTILLQILHQPLIDADPTPSRQEFHASPGLDGHSVECAWRHYIGEGPASSGAIPAHRMNLEGLPPAFISCAEVDPSRDEAIQYADRLLHAYVRTELHVLPGTFHGFDTVAPESRMSRDVRALHADALRRALERALATDSGL